ncbi:MAG: hypothetical protein ACFFBK_04920 [Promethearchaeota archaeon]
MENKSSIFGIIALVIGASGLGFGAYSVVNFQVVEGPQGIPGEDGQDGVDGIDGIDGLNGTDGQDAPGGLVVRIIDPDHRQTVSDIYTIRGLVYGSNNYTISVLRNGIEIGTSLSTIWDTTIIEDGWWNITVIVKDIETNITNNDDVIVFVQNWNNGMVPADDLNHYIYFTVWSASMLYVEVTCEAVNMNYQLYYTVTKLMIFDQPDTYGYILSEWGPIPITVYSGFGSGFRPIIVINASAEDYDYVYYSIRYIASDPPFEWLFANPGLAS